MNTYEKWRELKEDKEYWQRKLKQTHKINNQQHDLDTNDDKRGKNRKN